MGVFIDQPLSPHSVPLVGTNYHVIFKQLAQFVFFQVTLVFEITARACFQVFALIDTPLAVANTGRITEPFVG